MSEWGKGWPDDTRESTAESREPPFSAISKRSLSAFHSRYSGQHSLRPLFRVFGSFLWPNTLLIRSRHPIAAAQPCPRFAPFRLFYTSTLAKATPALSLPRKAAA